MFAIERYDGFNNDNNQAVIGNAGHDGAEVRLAAYLARRVKNRSSQDLPSASSSKVR